MSNKRPEPHVAQQSRRDKLRIIQNNNNPQHFEDFPNNLEQLSLEPRFNSDVVQVRSVRNNANNMLYEPGFYSSEMVNFTIDSNPFSESGRLMMPQFASVYPDQQCEVSNWRNNNGSHSHQGYDWVVNETNPNPNSIFVSEIHNDLTATREIHQTTSLQDIIYKSGMGSPILQQTSHGIWAENSNQQLVSLPNLVNRSNQSRFGNSNSLHQGLSLSLSSNVQSDQSPCVVSKEPQFSKSVKSSNMFSVVSGDCGKSSLQNNIGYRNVGPLGPFTGYATILKSSSFLEPAQQLLEEICSQSTQKLTTRFDVSSTSSSSGAVNAATESGVGSKDSTLGVSSSAFHSSNENGNGNENCGDRASRLSSGPEYQQRMAKFLYMQEEVIRRYKQHHQQMKMVLSSFESVAGLSSSTPYVSKALKSVSRQFKYLENAISVQLKHIQEVLGQELTASTSAGTTSSSKFVSNMARVRFMDQSFQKNKFILGSTGLLEHQHHAWRPHQKGLPERAVAVLRAWLFEHFLHPYPTDADKHMLAAQTGLSRNQVSNWFINARVRVWKPMVEEIHMLETKGMTGDINDNPEKSSKNEGPSGVEPGVNNQIQEVEELEWNGEKRCKVQCEIRSSMDGTLMSTFVPYRRGELDVGEVGSVSLTLGLTHGVEGQQQLLEEQQQHRRYFGGQMIDDFVG